MNDTTATRAPRTPRRHSYRIVVGAGSTERAEHFVIAHSQRQALAWFIDHVVVIDPADPSELHQAGEQGQPLHDATRDAHESDQEPPDLFPPAQDE